MQRLLFILVIFLATANLMVWGFLGFEKAYADKVFPGIGIDAQPLVGLTHSQVVDRLKPLHDALLIETVTLHLADKEFTPTLTELGYSVNTSAMADAAMAIGRADSLSQRIHSAFTYYQKQNIPLVYEIDQGVFDNYLNEIGKGITKEPINMSFDYADGSLIMFPAEDGITLDKEKLRLAIQEKVRPGETATILLEYGKQSPVIASESQVEAAKVQLTKLLSKPLTVQAEDVAVTIEPKTIFSLIYFDIVDNALVVRFNEDSVRSQVSQIAKKVDLKAVPKKISAVNNEVLEEGTDGRELDAPDTTKQLLARLDAANFETPITAKTTKIDRKTVSYSPEYQTGRYPGRYIEIDLSAQRMHLLEGDQYHKTFLISTGNWSHPTPIGTFQILNHIKVAWSSRYKLYMPHWMAIQPENGAYDGYGIHGLPYWPNGKKEGVDHLGKPVSHGCIRLSPDEAPYVYEWAVNGTKVIIHE